MRYTRLTTVVHKLFDGIIDDEKTIKDIFFSLKQGDFVFKLRARDLPRYDLVRVLEVDDNGFLARIDRKSGVLVKRIPFSDVSEVEINTFTQKMLRVKSERMNRWSLLDPCADFGNLEHEK